MSSYPRAYDAMLGGQAPPPTDGAVLGGLNGVKQRLARGTTEQKIDALLDAFEYGQAGLDLIIHALEDKSRQVRDAAYWLVTESTAEIAKQALWNYLPYAQMQCLHLITELQLDPDNLKRNPDYFAISSDGRSLVCEWEINYKISIVQFWNLWTGQLIHSMDSYHHAMGLSQDGRLIVSHYQHLIKVENAQTGKTIRYFFSGFSDIRAFAVSPSREPLVACSDHTRYGNSPMMIKVWDYQAEQLVHTLQWEVMRDFGTILSISISPDGKTLLSQSVEKYDQFQQIRSYQVLRLWDMQTGELIHMLKVPRAWIDGNIQQIRRQTRRLEGVFVDSLAIHPDGRMLVSGLREGKVMVWDFYTNQAICSVPGLPLSIMTPDGKVLVCSSEANEIVVWDVENNQEICTLEGHASSIEQITLSPNREWIASYSADRKIKIWGVPE